MGRRKAKQRSLFVEAARAAQAPRHRFYEALNELLAEAGFDAHVEALCKMQFDGGSQGGRPSVPPGVYFRMLLLGYFEGIESERGICWRCEDSLSLKSFLGYEPHERTPDHSTLSRMRTRLGDQTYVEVFRFVMGVLNEKGLLKGKVAGVDSTYLRADASMKGIVRRESGEGYTDYLRRLAKDAGFENPTEEELRRFDRKRKDKKVSNEEWMSPVDPDAEIAKLKDGRTRLAYKAEHVVDMESGAILAADITAATQSDAESIVDSVALAEKNLTRAKGKAADVRDDDDSDEPPNGAAPNGPTRHLRELTGDKGYHKASTLEELDDAAVRTYIPERLQRGRRRWKGKGGRRRANAVYRNRARTKRGKGKALQRKRGELIERSFAHLCETGAHRRTRLRELDNVRKRYLIHAAGFNLSLVMRQVLGHGTPRQYQDAFRRLQAALRALYAALCCLAASIFGFKPPSNAIAGSSPKISPRHRTWTEATTHPRFSTAC